LSEGGEGEEGGEDWGVVISSWSFCLEWRWGRWGRWGR